MEVNKIFDYLLVYEISDLYIGQATWSYYRILKFHCYKMSDT